MDENSFNAEPYCIIQPLKIDVTCTKVGIQYTLETTHHVLPDDTMKSGPP